MSYTPSVNIERDFGRSSDHYIVTPNAKQTVGKVISHYADGIHSFCLIGSYGTGKSSFIIALENSLMGRASRLNNLLQLQDQFNGFKDFLFVNIVGQYKSLSRILIQKVTSILEDLDPAGDGKTKLSEKHQTNKGDESVIDDTQALNLLNLLYQRAQKKGKFLVIVIDEFGKVLEHAAKNNPEKEMYFLQQVCEWANNPDHNILLLTTLHQGFGAYAKQLSTEQRQEWTKVKGRFLEIVFNEPVEQLLALTAQRLNRKVDKFNEESVKSLYHLAIESKFTSEDLNESVASALYPLDIFAAYVLTKANQRYGQNERTLFTFLESTGVGSIKEFTPGPNFLYNIVDVYDYIYFHFHSVLQEVNEDSTNWAAIKTAIERVEGLSLKETAITDAISLVKIIGLLGIFAPASTRIDADFMTTYCRYALDREDISVLISILEKSQIIRYAKYKGKYILFEGTDVDIQAGLFEAARVCKRPTMIAERLSNEFEDRQSLANAYFFRTGTPRFFQYLATSEPIEKVDKGEIDGFINLLFNNESKERCLTIQNEAILYCIFKDVNAIKRHLFELDKLNWVKEVYITDHNDKIALREIDNLAIYERSLLNKLLNESLFTENVDWVFNGETLGEISSVKALMNRLSKVCGEVYSKTPTFRNELINKHKPNSQMSVARQNFLTALLEKSDEPLLGFEESKFPPEKTIYLTLLVNTGIMTDTHYHSPEERSFEPLWEACNDFLKSTVGKSRKISELYSILSEKPFRLKQGFLDVWIPTYLILRRDDYALYSSNQYVPLLTKDVLDLMLKAPSNYSIKAFSVEGVRREFFNNYRDAIRRDRTELNSGTFIETIRPFLTLYRRLNDYTKHTRDLSAVTRGFRDVLAKATDPEKTFFEDLPEAMGYKEIMLAQNPEAINSFADVLQTCIHELLDCYNEFVSTIESAILKQLKLKSTDYKDYITTIKSRFKNLKTQLMPTTTLKFYNRLIGSYEDRTTWIEALSYTILNKPLSQIKDSDKPALFHGIQQTLFQLEDYIEMHHSDDVDVVRMHITANSEKPLIKQVVLPKDAEREVHELEAKIRKLLSDNPSINTAALLNILKSN